MRTNSHIGDPAGVDSDGLLTSDRVLSRCRTLLGLGLRQALSASLYESPGDILFTYSALIVELLNHGLQSQGQWEGEPLSFRAWVMDNDSTVLCKWSPEHHGTEAEDFCHAKPAAYAEVFEEGKIWIKSAHGMEELWLTKALTDAHTLHACIFFPVELHSIAGGQLDLAGVVELVIDGWEELAMQRGSELYLGAGEWQETIHNSTQNGDSLLSLQRTLTSRFREGLQRLEEELPHELRVHYDPQGVPVPSQLYFLRRCYFPESTANGTQNRHGSGCSIPHWEEGFPAYLMTHEDLRLLRHWIDEGSEALTERLRKAACSLGYYNASLQGVGQDAMRKADQVIDQFIEDLSRSDQDTCLSMLRTAYERPLHVDSDEQAMGQLPVERTLYAGAPVISWNQKADALYYEGRNSKNDVLVAIIERAFWEAQPLEGGDAGRKRNILFWPVNVLGQPLLIVHLSFFGDNPIFSQDDNAFQNFIELIRVLARISESAWDLFFDLYCDLFVENFSSLYLEYVRDRRDQRLSGRQKIQLEKVVNQLNEVTQLLGRILNIRVATWEMDGDQQPAGEDENLWVLQSKLEPTEEDRSKIRIEQAEEMRLQKLSDERLYLERLILRPGPGVGNRKPEILFMYQHLSWRLGHYIRYTLPVLLMTLDYNTAYAMRRQREILRHELGGLVSGSRDLVMQMDEKYGPVRQDLRLMLRLVQRTLDSTGIDGDRIAIRSPHEPVDVMSLFQVIQRNFPAKLCITTEGGYTGQCEIHCLDLEGLKAWIAEEDLYAIWRNLWNNARQMLQDYSRETPSEGDRAERQIEIIRECGSFTDRFHPEAPPPPTVLALLYSRQLNGELRFFMDILDNVPQLKQREMNYPMRVKVGHYGVRIVDNIITQLSSHGYAGEFSLVQGLPADMATFYGQYESLRKYDWEILSNWTRTSICLSAEWVKD